MEFALPFFAFAAFVLGACIFALIVAVAVTVLARALKKSWRFSIVAGLVWLLGFGVLFGLALLAARYAALLVLDPLVHQHVSRERVVGIYEARYRWYDANIGGVELLVLKPDGTYTQGYIRRSGELITNNGKWEYRDDKEFGASVSLEDALMPGEDTSFRKELTRENFSVSPHSLFGRITLPLDPDSGFQYVKVMDIAKSTQERAGKPPGE